MIFVHIDGFVSTTSVGDFAIYMEVGIKRPRNYIRDCESLCLSDETVKAVGPFYLVSMPGELE